LNDALIFATARKHGLTALTRNTDDFDLLQQLDPFGKVFFLRAALGGYSLKIITRFRRTGGRNSPDRTKRFPSPNVNAGRLSTLDAAKQL
jgi:hypothetical protein